MEEKEGLTMLTVTSDQYEMEEWGSPIGGTIEALGNQGLKGKERRAVIFIEKSGELNIHLKG